LIFFCSSGDVIAVSFLQFASAHRARLKECYSIYDAFDGRKQ